MIRAFTWSRLRVDRSGSSSPEARYPGSLTTSVGLLTVNNWPTPIIIRPTAMPLHDVWLQLFLLSLDTLEKTQVRNKL